MMEFKFVPDKEYAKDTGLLIGCILLLMAYLHERPLLILPAILIQVLAMTFPLLFKPLAIFWHYATMMLGNVTNRIILSILFWGIVTPVGFARKYGGADPLKRRAWKKSEASVFTIRDHTFSADDLNNPY